MSSLVRLNKQLQVYSIKGSVRHALQCLVPLYRKMSHLSQCLLKVCYRSNCTWDVVQSSWCHYSNSTDMSNFLVDTRNAVDITHSKARHIFLIKFPWRPILLIPWLYYHFSYPLLLRLKWAWNPIVWRPSCQPGLCQGQNHEPEMKCISRLSIGTKTLETRPCVFVAMKIE